MRPLIIALPLVALAGCQSGGSVIPSVGAEIILRDVTIKLDEAQVRLLLTPAELESLARAVDTSGGGGGSGGGSSGGSGGGLGGGGGSRGQ